MHSNCQASTKQASPSACHTTESTSDLHSAEVTYRVTVTKNSTNDVASNATARALSCSSTKSLSGATMRTKGSLRGEANVSQS